MVYASPTLVLGVGEGLQPFLERLYALVETYVPGLLPLLRLGLWMPELTAVGSPSAEAPPGGPGDTVEGTSASQLVQWLEEVVTERNLEAARQANIEPEVAGGMLQIRVLLLVDGQSEAEVVQRALQALQEAIGQVRQRLPVRLLAVALAGEEKATLPFPLAVWLRDRASEQLTPLGLVLLDRWRSDGSSLGSEEVRLVLPFLLFTALLPTQGLDHWFFPPAAQVAESQINRFTYGFSVLIVPLPEIERALSHLFTKELLSLTYGHPELTLERFLEPLRLDETFGEPTCWQNLFTQVPVELSPEQSFVLQPLRGQVEVELSQLPWQEWAEHIASYDAALGRVQVARWREQMRQNAQETANHLREILHALLDAAVQEGRGLIALAQEGLQRVRDIVENWRCAAPNLVLGVPDPNLAARRQALEVALQKMPSGWATLVRYGLLVLMLLYTTFAAVRGLGDQGWKFVAAGGAVGFLLALMVAWSGVAFWRAGEQKVFAARDAYLAAIAAKYAAVLRCEGILILRKLRLHLLEQIEKAEQTVEQLQQQLQQAVEEAQKGFAAFAPPQSVVVRPVVTERGELESVADDLWRGRDLKPWLQNLLASLHCCQFQALTQALGREDFLAQGVQQARILLWERLFTSHQRSLEYYLQKRLPQSQARAEWLQQEIHRMHEQAKRLLWSVSPAGCLTYQVLPLEEEELSTNATASHPETLPESQLLFVPGMLGTLCQQRLSHSPLESGEEATTLQGGDTDEGG